MAKFAPGTSGNPAGRPKGTGVSGRLRQSIEKEMPAIIDRLVQSALAGDTQAASVLISRALPALRATDPPMPAIAMASLEEAPQAVLEALGKGILSPGQATTIGQLLTALARAKETSELESRISALEVNHANRP